MPTPATIWSRSTSRFALRPDGGDRLLTDFVGRPKIDQEELDKERGVVIQEIARYADQPSMVAEELIDKAAFGDHPLGRTVLGPADHLRPSRVNASWRSAAASGAARTAASSSSATSPRGQREGRRLFGRFPTLPRRTVRAAPSLNADKLVTRRDSNQSHLR